VALEACGPGASPAEIGFGKLGVDFVEPVVESFREAGRDFGMAAGQVLGFTEIGAKIVEFPAVVFVVAQQFPVAFPDGADR